MVYAWHMFGLWLLPKKQLPESGLVFFLRRMSGQLAAALSNTIIWHNWKTDRPES